MNGYSAELGSAFNGIAPHPPVLISERYWDTASETPPESVEKMSP
ncbi:hypothetical protein [Actinomadura madurae]|nr:hypothetical protein [Actinomadura madurae]